MTTAYTYKSRRATTTGLGLIIAVLVAMLAMVTGAPGALAQQAVPPLVAVAIPDTTVAEDSGPIDNFRDLNSVFGDAEDGDSLAFAVESNSNPTLVTAVIDADSALDLSFAPDGNGVATIVIRATDAELFSVTDTFVVTVTAVNDTPQVVVSIPDTTVAEDSGAIDNYRDLNGVFGDIEDGDALTFVIDSNSNSALVTAVIDADSALDLAFAPDGNGAATIVVRATDAGLVATTDTFVVTVTAVPDTPRVALAIADTTVAEDAVLADYRDLNRVFYDPEDGGALSFSIDGNSNPLLVTAAIDADSALDITLAPDTSGVATLVIRATDSSLSTVTDTFTVTVYPVNDDPVVVGPIPDTTVLENAAPVDNYHDLTTVFDDVEDGPGLTFTVQSNSDPALVNVTIDPDSMLDLSFASDDEGTATIVIRATDSSGDWVDESFDVWVHRTMWWVNADGSGQRPSISSALNATVDGDTIMLTDGTYTGGGNSGLSFGGKDVVLTSVSGAASTIIDLQGNDRFVILDSGEGPATVIEKITVINGNKTNGGTFKLDGSSATIRDVVVLNGSGESGAAFFCDGGGTPSFLRCVIAGNTASDGAGIYLNGVDAIIDGCTIVGNAATLGGAGIHARNSSNPTITNTIIAFSTQGPGIACVGGGGPVLSCSNIFGNAGGDAICGTDGGGNISADPLFCVDPLTGQVTISAVSPCAPANNGCGVLIGVGAVACGPPLVVAALPDTTVDIGQGTISKYRDLNDVFFDTQDGTVLAFSIEGNSNPALVTAVIDADSALGFIFNPTVSGIATIVVRATDSDLMFAESAMTINVIGGTVTVLARHDGGTALRPGDAAGPIYRLTVVSSSAVAETLTAVTFQNASSGAGSQSDLDNDFSPLTLVSGDGETILPGGASGTAGGVLAAGSVTFSGLEVVLAPGGWRDLLVEGGATLVARDGDVLDLAVSDSLALSLTPPVDVSGVWPLRSGAGFPVDGMMAAQAAVHPVTPAALSTGTIRNLVFDITLPANGYAADVLDRINVVNLGTARAGTDIARLDAWLDDGSAAYDSLADPWLGAFSYTGSRWELTGLSEPVPLGGLRVFVTADINTLGVPGRSIRLAVPARPDLGVGMASGNDGPLDVALEQPSALSITSSASVVLAATAVAPGTTNPGADDVVLLHVVATNNTGAATDLSRLTVTNRTVTQGGAVPGDADSETQALLLRIDGNDNGMLDDVATDPVAGASFFNGGTATFTGVSWNLPASQSRHLFVTADVSITDARDGDVLAAVIGNAYDVDLSDATVVVADWPVTSGAAWTIDGMLASQLTNLGGMSATLAPGDGPTLAMDFIVPANGYADDVLDAVVVENLATASGSDLADVRLWRDGGDGQFTPGAGDDTELGPLVRTGSAWTSPLLGEPVSPPGARLFVGVTVAGAPTDSSSVHLAVPVNGITMSSGNDGPIDQPLVGAGTLLLSTSPLLATIEVSPPASTVGQDVTVRMIVRNVGGEQVDVIAPSAMTVSGDALLAVSGGPQPATFSLATAAVDTFVWTYTALGTGVAVWSGSCAGTGAVSSLPRAALATESQQHRVFAQAGNLAMTPTATMPLQINRGQSDVVPLSLTFTGSGGAGASDTRLLGLRIRLEDGSGAGIVPGDLLASVSVGEGNVTYISRSALETTGAEIDLTFASPVLVRAGEQATLAIRMAIDPSTIIPAFRVAVMDSTWISAVDAVSGAPVGAVLDQPPYPYRTNVGRITESPSQLTVAGVVTAATRAGRGQSNVGLMTVDVANPGTDGLTADIDVARFAVTVTDTSGAPVLSPGSLFERIRVVGPGGTLADEAWADPDSAILRLALAPSAPVPVNTTVRLSIAGDIAPGAALGAYRLRLVDPAGVDARDSNTGASLPVAFLTPTVAGHAVRVEALADTMVAYGMPRFPATVSVGQQDVPAFTAVARHPGTAGVAAIAMNAVTIRFQNAQRGPMVPGSVVNRIRLQVDGVEVADVTSVPGTGDAVTIALAGAQIAPGDSLDIDVRVDISAAAPQSFVEMVVDAVGLAAADANLLTPIVVAPDGGGVFPITSGLTQLLAPATELEVALDDRMPAVLSGGAADVTVAGLGLANTAPPGSGPIRVERLTLRAARGDGASASVGSAVERVSVYAGVAMLAQSAPLTVDSTTATITFGTALVIEPGTPLDLDVRLDLVVDPTVPGIRVGIDEIDVGVQQPASALLEVDVTPPPGKTFPQWTETGNFTARTLAGSFSNFPNPFAAGRAPTTFVYYLPTDADVSLRLFTLRGESVVTLVSGGRRLAGLHQSDIWDGRNGRGVAVQNGVYVAELVVRFLDGGSERLLRKVAVLR